MDTLNTRKRIILTTALAGLTLLIADTTPLRAAHRIARITAATQESQKFESLLSARMAQQADPIESSRTPRLVRHLRAWVARLRLPAPPLAPLSELQRARFEGSPMGIGDAHLRRGRMLDQRRYPSEPE